MVPQVVGDFAVGVGAGLGAKRLPTRPIEASRRLEPSDQRKLPQIIEGMGGSPGKVSTVFLKASGGTMDSGRTKRCSGAWLTVKAGWAQTPGKELVPSPECAAPWPALCPS